VSAEELLLEIVLQDRANFHISGRTHDREDQDDGGFFKEGNLSRAREKLKLLKVAFSGDKKRFFSGEAIVEVQILKDELLRIRVVE